MEHITHIKWIKSNKHIATATDRITLFDDCIHTYTWIVKTIFAQVRYRAIHPPERELGAANLPAIQLWHYSVPFGPSRRCRAVVCLLRINDTCPLLSSCSFAAVVHVPASTIILQFVSTTNGHTWCTIQTRRLTSVTYYSDIG